jgi:succinate dehydrogenase / fumarate reductase flavoprotein subunit
MDMEFDQFHPTGLYKLGILLSEAARGEGGILRNSTGEAFAARYAPTLKDLAPRDMVSRFIYQEVKEGRGIDGKDYVHLDLSHLPPEVIDAKLPDVTDFARTYLGVEPKTEPVPIQPTAHYAMGGIPTDINGRVIRDPEATPIPGFYSAGESACVSVHGANRLGTNSLVDLVVFGRRAGRHMLDHIQKAELAPLPNDPEFTARAEVAALLDRQKGERAADIRSAMQVVMMDKVSVVRDGTGMAEAKETIRDLRRAYGNLAIQDRGQTFNTDLMEALELGYMLDCAETIVAGAIAREESRGAHRVRTEGTQVLSVASRKPLKETPTWRSPFASSVTTPTAMSNRSTRNTSSTSNRPTGSSTPSIKSSGTRMVPSPTAARAPTAFAAPTRCGSMVAIAWRAKS